MKQHLFNDTLSTCALCELWTFWPCRIIDLIELMCQRSMWQYSRKPAIYLSSIQRHSSRKKIDH